MNPSMKHLISLIKASKFAFKYYLIYSIFGETIKLREELYIRAYATNENAIKVQFKRIGVNEFDSGGMLLSFID